MGPQTQLAESNADMELNPDSATTTEGLAEKVIAGGGESPKQILVVDDERPIRLLLQKILEANGYLCRTAENASDARNLLDEFTSDLVLCDINMPGESGLDFIRFVLKAYPDTAAIMVSAIGDPHLAESMLELGVYDYIIKPMDRNGILISVANAFRRRELEMANRSYRRNLEQMVDERTDSLQRSMSKLENAMNGIVRAIAHTVETRDPYTAGHQRRVADLAAAIAQEVGFDRDQIEAVRVAAIIHDLGKISVPAEILSKPSRLTANEFNLIKEHPQVGYDIVKDIEFPWDVSTMVYQHHEKLDGSGYPLGAAGDEILPESRVLTVADVVEAMASHRPYRPGLGVDVALGEIDKNKGKFYDPELARACISLFKSGRFSFD
ncbi:MAG: response regulator [Desulfobacterales bacterium]|nr:response regulator [Desulfobacterales bacterium]